MAAQARFGDSAHDSLQYHFRCGDHLGAARLFRSESLDHASVWLHDGRRLRRLHDGTGPLRQGRGPDLDVTDGPLRIVDRDGAVVLSLGDGFRATLRPRRRYGWDDTISTVIHEPDMDCALDLDGERHAGVAYCKRYAWTPAPRRWGYRFVQGWTDDGAALWTAEATFGAAKYDYFRLLERDGRLREGDPDSGRHRQDAAFADLPEGPCAARLEEVAVWEAALVSPVMDSLLRQRVCRLTLETPEGRRTGLAINETCFGTLG